MISVLFVVCVLAILACNLLTVILFYLDKDRAADVVMVTTSALILLSGVLSFFIFSSAIWIGVFAVAGGAVLLYVSTSPYRKESHTHWSPHS